MKSISAMLHRGNLTPREKYLLLVQNDIQRARTGKDILTEADKEALENWKAQNNDEVDEWNRLNEAWKHSGRVEIEAEFVYKDAQVAYMTQLPIIMKLLYYPTFYRISKSIKMLEDIKKVTLDGALEITAKQKAAKMKDGLDVDYFIYRLAFELLNDTDKESMNELYPDVETDHQYLDQEEIIANLFDGKSTLTQEAKERLASLVSERAYNKFAKEYQLFHYFACIPILEIAKYFLTSKGISIKIATEENKKVGDRSEKTYEVVTKAIEDYSNKNGVTIENILKEACLSWLDNGLLNEYRPLAISNHDELLKRWLLKRTEAKNLLLEYIKNGVLKLRVRDEEESRKSKLYSKNLCNLELQNARLILRKLDSEAIEKSELEEKVAFDKFSDSVVTGESLYAWDKNYEFINDFKKRVDEYEPNLGIVYADDDPEQNGAHLDRELLITNLNENGKPNFLSFYEMSVTVLSGLFQGMEMFEEEIIDGQKFLKFVDGPLKNIFADRCMELIAGYAKLLAFENIIKKLSKVYEVDLAYNISDKVKMLRTYMEDINKAINCATNNNDIDQDNLGFWDRKDRLIFKDQNLIDIDSIKPDMKSVEEHEQKFRKILGEF